MSELEEQDLDRFRSRLVSRRAELAALAESRAEDRQAVELDQTRVGRLSRMDALQGQAMSLATHKRRQDELRRIELALQRLDAGEYGYCTACGVAISPKRLDLDPAVPICIDCAAAGERE
ncbi:MAG: TraR/DksA family transcriptional regulator [Pseudomonadota bacterium]